MKKSFVLYIQEIQPTKLYLDSEKIQSFMKIDTEEIPVSVKVINDEITLIKGHEFAYAKMLKGEKQISVCWEENLEDLGYYEDCIIKCQEKNIRTIRDLESYVYDSANYKKLVK